MVRLLVISDAPDQRRDVVNAASEAGFDRDQIQVVQSWDEAETALREPFDLAVIDLGFEYWGRSKDAGIQLIRSLHDLQPDCVILALTSQRGAEFGLRAMEEGAREFIYTEWKYISWYELLVERLRLYDGFIERLRQRNSSPT